MHAEARDPQSVRRFAVEKCKDKKETKAFPVSDKEILLYPINNPQYSRTKTA